MNELVISILEDFLGEHKNHNEEKGQISFDCPACALDKGIESDGKGNLEVNYKKGVFKCWACHQYNDMSGSIGKLIKRFGNQQILKKYNQYKPEYVSEYQPIAKKSVINLPKGFKELIYPSKDNDYHLAINYLRQRNIGLDIISRYKLGYTTEGKETGRIIIPSFDKNKEINYYTGRAFKNIWPKYSNIDYDKKLIIFNEYQINWDATVYLVEGPFDHLVVPNSIPLLGKYISDLLFSEIFAKANSDIVIILDDDAKFDIDLLYKKLNTNKLFNRVKVVYLPYGYDIAKIHQKLGKSGVLKALRMAKQIPESRNFVRIKLQGI